MNWKMIGTHVGLPALAWASVLAIIALLNYLEIRPVVVREIKAMELQIAANNRAVQLIRWQILNEKRKNEGLSVSEAVEFCEISSSLGLKGEGCA